MDEANLGSDRCSTQVSGSQLDVIDLEDIEETTKNL